MSNPSESTHAGNGSGDASESDIPYLSEVTGPVYSNRRKTKILVCSIIAPFGAGHTVHDKKLKVVKDEVGKDVKRDKDVIYFTQLFQKQEHLRDIEILQDVEYQEFVDNIETNTSFKTCGSIVFAFLTHLGKDNEPGISDEKLHFKDKLVSIEEVQDKIKSVKALVGKPKILIIQADHHSPIEVNKQIFPLQPRDNTNVYREIKIPTDSDMLVMMSTVPRYLPSEASFLLQAFGDVMDRNWRRVKDEQEDFLTLTVEMNASFEELFKAVPRVGGDTPPTPLPMVTSTLRQLLYL